MTFKEFQAFKQRYQELLPHVEEPDLFIYLKTSMETMKERITQRGRGLEELMDKEFLNTVTDCYEHFFGDFEQKFNKSKLLVINTDSKSPKEVFNIASEYISTQTSII